MSWATGRPLALILAALGLTLLWRAGAEAATPQEVQRMVIEEALNSRVPPSLALAVARVESDFRDRVESSAGARGVMQIMPATAIGEFGVAPDELWDARLNIQLGVHFLEQLIDRYGGRWDAALSHYNGGSLQGSGRHAVPHAFNRGYVQKVLQWQRRYAEQAAMWRVPPGSVPPTFVPARTGAVVAAKSDAVPHAAVKDETKATGIPMRRPPIRRDRAGGLDDAGSALEQRRRANRGRLDDFQPRIRWHSG